MAENKIYLAIGEETVRGARESAAVGFIPLLNPGIPKMEFDDKRRKALLSFLWVSFSPRYMF